MTVDTRIAWPLGSHKGKPAGTLPLNYLCWFVSVDDVRRVHPVLARTALEVLRNRLHAPGRAEAELGVPLVATTIKTPATPAEQGTGAAPLPGGGEDAIDACEPQSAPLPELW